MEMMVYVKQFSDNHRNKRDTMMVQVRMYEEVERFFSKKVRRVQFAMFHLPVNATSLHELNGDEIVCNKLYNMARCWDDLEWLQERILEKAENVLSKQFYTSEVSSAICIDCHPDLEATLNI